MTLPPEALAQHCAIVGKTGSGKTYTAKGEVERLLEAGARVCIVDPTGVWWGLRSSADGKQPAYSVAVFGGDHADVEISRDAGARLAELIAGRNLPCVVDLSEFSLNGQKKFMTDFAVRLYEKNRAPLHLILDEADEFAPQQPLPDSKRLLGAVDRIIRRGRTRGFRAILITQRPAVLHKNVLTQCNSLVAMRLVAPQDRNAIKAWIEGQADVEKGKEVLASLPQLKLGEGWVWAPEQGVLSRESFPKIKTFDSSKTPEEGDAPEASIAVAKIDVSKLRKLLAPEETEKPKGTPKRQANRGQSSSQDRKKLAETRAALAKLIAETNAERARTKSAMEALLLDLCGAADRVREIIAASTGEMKPPVAIAPPPKPKARPKAQNGGLHSASRKILTVLHELYPARLSWRQACSLAGLKPTGGHVNTGRRQMFDEGLAEQNGGRLQITDKGVATLGLGKPSAPKTPEEEFQMWLDRLPSPAPEMLRALKDFGGLVTTETLAGFLGKQPRGGHWNTGMRMLKDNDLIENRADGIVLHERFRGAK